MHIIIMGAPGAGKGTYAKTIKEHFGIPHISTGDMFRQAISEETELGKLAKSFMDKGHLVPDDVTIGIVKERLSKPDCKKGFILDGFPRTIEQAQQLDVMLKELGIELDAVVNLMIDDEEIIKRITNRRLCSNCGRGYNIISVPPRVEGVCDVCGAPLYQRKDDNRETIQARLDVYSRQTKPLVEYYEQQGNILHIDSVGKIEDVINEIISKLEGK